MQDTLTGRPGYGGGGLFCNAYCAFRRGVFTGRSPNRPRARVGPQARSQSPGKKLNEAARRGHSTSSARLLHSDPPDAEKAESRYRQALTLAEELGMRPLVAHCHLGLGKLYRRTGSSNRLASNSPSRRRCTARWTCASGWSRRRGNSDPGHFMNRRAFVRTFAGGLLAAPLAAEGQQPETVYRVGLLSGGSAVGVGLPRTIFVRSVIQSERQQPARPSKLPQRLHHFSSRRRSSCDGPSSQDGSPRGKSHRVCSGRLPLEAGRDPTGGRPTALTCRLPARLQLSSGCSIANRSGPTDRRARRNLQRQDAKGASSGIEGEDQGRSY